MIEDNKHRIKLDLLFVHPDYQHSGIATTLIRQVIRKLHQQSAAKLFSSYHVCNNISKQWHEQIGFKVIPHGYYAQLKYSWYRDESYRLKAINPEQDTRAIDEQMRYWQEKAKDWWRVY